MVAACATMLHSQTGDVRVDGATVSNPGIYSLSVMKDIPDPSTAEGVRHTVGNLSFVSTTTTIPARIGVHFGFTFTVTGAPAGALAPLRYVNRFPGPGLTNPATGEITHEEEYTQNLSVGASDYKGWSFEVWYGDRKLCEQSFDVVAAQ